MKHICHFHSAKHFRLTGIPISRINTTSDSRAISFHLVMECYVERVMKIFMDGCNMNNDVVVADGGAVYGYG